MFGPHTLPPREFHGRLDRLRAHADEHGLDGLVIFDAMRIFYLTGFYRLADERPLVMVARTDGDVVLLVPHLEEENVPVRTPDIREVRVYREFPGERHPMDHLADLLKELALDGATIGVDAAGSTGGAVGAGWYSGPSLPDIAPNATLHSVQAFIDRMRIVKSPAEVELIRMSAQFGNLAHSYLKDEVHVGVTELEAAHRASTRAATAMAHAFGEDWEPFGGLGPGGAAAAFTSGPKTAFNHRQPGGRRVREGDVLLTFAFSEVGGYVSELERMFIVGEPTERHRRYFELEVRAQQAAFDAIRPGARCSDVERAVNAFLHDHDLYELTRTHIGHGLGLDIHEAPFFSLGDDTLLEPGMVMTVEPCLFIPGFAGFRHSDTLVVTDDGFDFITYYPRDIDSLTIPV